MGSHGVPVTRSVGLLLAALAALMLSGMLSLSAMLSGFPTSPVSPFPLPPLFFNNTVRLTQQHQLTSSTSSPGALPSFLSHPVLPRFFPFPTPSPPPRLPPSLSPMRAQPRNCGANAVCVKDRGSATCVSNVGFSMTPTGCVDACVFKRCGSNAKCVKSAVGVASCVCDTGFVLQPDGVTCTAILYCPSIGSNTLSCPPFPLSTRPDTCALKKCGVNGKCIKDSAGVASCVCNVAFALQPDGSTCTDTCVIKNCGANAACVKDAQGVASCVCRTGFQVVKGLCIGTHHLSSQPFNNVILLRYASPRSSLLTPPALGLFPLNPPHTPCLGVSTHIPLPYSLLPCSRPFYTVLTQIIYNCVMQNCGANGRCIKDETGAASCVCDTGFVLQPDGRMCTDTCALKKCGINGKCIKDSAGVASCVCDASFVLQVDGSTCTVSALYPFPSLGPFPLNPPNTLFVHVRTHTSAHFSLPVHIPSIPSSPISSTPHSSPLPSLLCPDTCVIKNCVRGWCIKDGSGAASCECSTGYVLQADGRTCKDTCDIKDCVNGGCMKDELGVASCVCQDGFALQADGRTCTHSCSLDPSSPFSLPPGPPFFPPANVCVIENCGLNGRCVRAGNAATCVCDPGYVLQADGRTCKDTCEIQKCGGNGTCSKDKITGAASCVCNPGFVLQADGRTCKDVCEIQSCGANGQCRAGDNSATCQCDQGYELQQDGKTCLPTPPPPAAVGG
ncbi:unnamed protein product [Closterium sp. NIES-65]|nr:unnamed protein product [Closterium sp. NIES-65]